MDFVKKDEETGKQACPHCGRVIQGDAIWED